MGWEKSLSSSWRDAHNSVPEKVPSHSEPAATVGLLGFEKVHIVEPYVLVARNENMTDPV